MNESTHATQHQARKSRRFSWLFEEWVVQLALVVVVGVAFADGFLSLGGGALA